MEKNDRVVHGSYDNSEETISAIEKLQAEGYTREQIRVYGNTTHEKTFDKTEGDPEKPRVDRSFDKVDEDSTDRAEKRSFDKSEDKDNRQDTDDDESMWEKVKDLFTSDSYDYEEESHNPNYRKENDVLYPHRNDLAGGKRVIVLDKANENQTRINI